MTANPMTSKMVVRWISFREHGEQIMRLRRQVFCDDQGFKEDFLPSVHDPDGLHLCAFDDGELVSAISAFIFELNQEEAERYGLPAGPGLVAQFGKRVQRSSYRGKHIGQLLVSAIIREVYEIIRPRLTFALLRGIHKDLLPYYLDVLGFKYHTMIEEPSWSTIIFAAIDAPALRSCYLKTRKVNIKAAAELGIYVPSLARFLEQTGRTDLIAMDRLTEENLYTAPLSLQDELPRLSAQTRLLLLEQKSRIAAVDFPPPPARLLDAGAGPGVYLSQLSREPKFKGYELVGLDLSNEMVMYARLNRPDLRWIQASIYDTGEPACAYDVVHANFLFLHLLSPALALGEIYRILRPGGVLYVLDVNDSTFQGPPVISRLIELHTNLCQGDRSVLNSLPHIAEERGLSLRETFSTRISNTASSHESVFAEGDLKFDTNTLWGLFSFIGQREELTDQFKSAQDYYFTSDCKISICIQTHVYRKNG